MKFNFDKLTAIEIDNDSELLKRLSAGCERSFNQLYENYSGTVFNTIMSFVQDPEEAKEVLQQVFIKLWERREVMNQVSNLRDYLFVSSRNGVFDYFNQLARQAKLKSILSRQNTYASFNPEEQLDKKELSQRWLEAIERLPPQQKLVYQWIEQQNWTLDQAAETLQLSKSTVKKHLELSRRSVKNFLKVTWPTYHSPITVYFLYFISHFL